MADLTVDHNEAFNGSESTPSEQPLLDLVRAQPSPDILQSLLASVNDLQREVSQLRDDKAHSSQLMTNLQRDMSQIRVENAILSSEMRTLAQASEAKFRYFGRLPREIRCMIWGYALLQPQIHIINTIVPEKMVRTNTSKSRLNDVMEACHDARVEGIKLNQLFYRVSRLEGKCTADPDKRIASSFKNYMTRNDTFYLPGHNPWPAEMCEFHCSQCKESTEYMSCWGESMSRRSTCQSHGISVLAVDYDSGLHCASWPSECAELVLWFGHVPEVYIVLRDGEEAMIDRDITFQTPIKSPLNLPTIPRAEGGEHPKMESWKAMEAAIVEELEAYKATRTEERRAALEGK